MKVKCLEERVTELGGDREGYVPSKKFQVVSTKGKGKGVNKGEQLTPRKQGPVKTKNKLEDGDLQILQLEEF